MTSVTGTAAPSGASPVPGSSAAGRAPARPAARRRRPGGRRASLRMALEVLFFVGPALLLFSVFVVWPIVRAVQFSLYRWKGFGPLVDFVGLQNYVSVLTNEVFTDAFRHNMTIVVLSILVQLPVALAIALLLNRRMRGQGVLRAVIFVPYVLSEVIAGVVWLQLLQPEYGVVDTMLGAVGISGPEQGWLGTPEVAIWTLLRRAHLEVHRLRGASCSSPGCRACPDELVRGGRDRRRRAGGRSSAGSPCPLLGPTIRIWAFLSMIGSLQLFDVVWILTGGGPAELDRDDGDLHGHRGLQALATTATAARSPSSCSSSRSSLALLYQRLRAAPRHRAGAMPEPGGSDEPCPS